MAPFWTCPKIPLWEKSDIKWTSSKQCTYEPIGGTWSQARNQCLAILFRNKSIVFQMTFTELNSLVSGNLHLNSFSRYLLVPVKPSFISCLFCITAIRVLSFSLHTSSLSAFLSSSFSNFSSFLSGSSNHAFPPAYLLIYNLSYTINVFLPHKLFPLILGLILHIDNKGKKKSKSLHWWNMK